MVRGFAVLAVIGAALFAAVRLEQIGEPPSAERADQGSPAAYGPRTVLLRADDLGHFLVTATVNGRAVDMLADTGASAVALKLSDARRAGFDPRGLSFDVPVKTANGETRVARIVLDRVDVGGIVLKDVPAMVAMDDTLDTSLLGMSFLGRLASVKLSGDTLELVE